MPHNLHFMERLERLDDADVRFALQLYRDPELVRILIQTCAPKDAVRVAIAVRHREGGPHLLASRDGHFVTCLGAGMKHDLPVVARAAVDVLSTREKRVREALQLSRREDTGALPPLAKLVDGSRPTREEVAQIVAWTPLFPRAALDATIARYNLLLASGARLFHCAGFKARHLPDIQRFCDAAWSLGYFMGPAMLASSMGWARDETVDGKYVRTIFPCLAAESMLPATMLRASAAAGALGPLVTEYLVTTIKAVFQVRELVVCSGALVVAGLRHPALRDDVAKKLLDLSLDPDFNESSRAIFEAHRRVLEKPEAALERYAAHAREWLDASYTDLPELTDQDLLAVRLIEIAPLSHAGYVGWMADALAYLAAVEFADTFLPERIAHEFPPDDVEARIAFADYARRFTQASEARLEKEDAPPAPGRNAPCHCGSGKKFKKCHGA